MYQGLLGTIWTKHKIPPKQLPQSSSSLGLGVLKDIGPDSAGYIEAINFGLSEKDSRRVYPNFVALVANVNRTWPAADYYRFQYQPGRGPPPGALLGAGAGGSLDFSSPGGGSPGGGGGSPGGGTSERDWGDVIDDYFDELVLPAGVSDADFGANLHSKCTSGEVDSAHCLAPDKCATFPHGFQNCKSGVDSTMWSVYKHVIWLVRELV